MTDIDKKRLEIREGLLAKVNSIRLWRTIYDDPLSPEDDVEDILKYLHSQGVVMSCPDGDGNRWIEPLKDTKKGEG